MKKSIVIIVIFALLLSACTPAAAPQAESGQIAAKGGYREMVIVDGHWVESQLAAFPGGAGFAYYGGASSTEAPYDFAYIWYQLQDGAVASQHEIPLGGRFSEYSITTQKGVYEAFFDSPYGTHFLPHDRELLSVFSFGAGAAYNIGINMYESSDEAIYEASSQWLFEDVNGAIFDDRPDFSLGSPVFMLEGKMLWTGIRMGSALNSVLLSMPDMILMDTKTGRVSLYPDIGISLLADNCFLFEDVLFVHSDECVTAYDALSGERREDVPKTYIGNGFSEYGIYTDKPVKFCGADSEAVYYVDSNGLNRRLHGSSVSEVLLEASRCLLSSNGWMVSDIAMVSPREFYVEYDDVSGTGNPRNILVSYCYNAEMELATSAEISVVSLGFEDLIETAVEDVRREFSNLSVIVNLPEGSDSNAVYSYTGGSVPDLTAVSDDTDALISAVREGRGPDIIIWDSASVKKLADEGLLMDLSSLVENPGMPDSLYTAFSGESGICALPIAVMIPGVIAERENADRWLDSEAEYEKTPYVAGGNMLVADVIAAAIEPLVLYDLLMRSDWSSLVTEKGLNTENYQLLLEHVQRLKADYASAVEALGIETLARYPDQSIGAMESLAVINQQVVAVSDSDYTSKIIKPGCYAAYLHSDANYYEEAFAGGVYLSQELSLDAPGFMFASLFGKNSVHAPYAVAISADAEDPEACAAFVSSLLSEKAQKLWQEYYNPYMPVLPSTLEATLLADRTLDPDVYVSEEYLITRDKLINLGIPELYDSFGKVEIVDFMLLDKLRTEALLFFEGDVSLQDAVSVARTIVDNH